jgi:putative membrane protein
VSIKTCHVLEWFFYGLDKNKSSMKNQAIIRNREFFYLFAIILFAGINSCTSNGKTDGDKYRDTRETAEKQNETKFDSRRQDRIAEFLMDAAESNLTEIKLAQLAQQNASLPEVKELAAMMEKEHKKMLEDVNHLASDRNVSVPMDVTEKGNAKHQRLVDKEGLSFDETYTEMMVDSHEETVDDFEDAEKDFEDDPDLKRLITDALPVIRMHLEHSEEVREKVKEKMKSANKEKRKNA